MKQNFQGVNTATSITGILKNKQISGTNFEPRGCNKTKAQCNIGEWIFETMDCGGGGWHQICTNADIQMCPSTIIPSADSMGKIKSGVIRPTDFLKNLNQAYTGSPNPIPTGTLSAKPKSVEFANKEDASISFGGTPQTIRCTYPVDAVKTLDDVNTWESNFGVDDPSYNNDIMPTFCAQLSTNGICDNDPVTDKKRTKCSRFHDVGASGLKCREWVSRMKATSAGTQIVNNTFNEFCRANNVDECKCINRSTDSDYRKIKADPAFGKLNDICWWKPCQQATDYLITTDLTSNLKCDAVICQNITNITGSTTGDIQQQGKINCDASSSPSPPTPGPSPPTPGPSPPTPGPSPPGPNPSPSPTPSPKPSPDNKDPPKKKFPLWTLAIIIPLALLLLGGIVYALFGKKKVVSAANNPPNVITLPAAVSNQVEGMSNSYDNNNYDEEDYDRKYYNLLEKVLPRTALF